MSFLIERYALSVMNFAAPINGTITIDTTKWINHKDQCVWPSIRCSGDSAVSLIFVTSNLSGKIPAEIGLLLDEFDSTFAA